MFSESNERNLFLFWGLPMSLFRFLAPSTVLSLGGLCDFEQNMCGWTHDPTGDVNWALHSPSSPDLDRPMGADGMEIFRLQSNDMHTWYTQ